MMKINTNSWNKLRYTLYTPGYDFVGRIFKNSRKRSIDSAEIKAGEKVLIIGAGTGLDLEFLPNNCEITATDLTPSMIERIKKRNRTLKLNVNALVMDGQNLQFDNNSFDVVILHLILAVIPNPIACIKEAERVLKPNGRIAVFDMFVPKNRKISNLRKAANFFTNFMFSDITRTFESIVNQSGFSIISDVPADFNGNFRLIKLVKE
jgi:phosphatidylethanolamine/phosphatidyl-N-methylethanolamine N-methyltransferase